MKSMVSYKSNSFLGFFPTLPSLLVPTLTLLASSLVVRVHYRSRVVSMKCPIGEYVNYIFTLSSASLAPSAEVENLALDAIAVPAQHGANESCLVVVVKTFLLKFGLAYRTQVSLYRRNLLPNNRDVLGLDSYHSASILHKRSSWFKVMMTESLNSTTS